MKFRTRHTFTALVGVASVLFVGLAQVGTASAATNPHVDIVGGGDLGDPSVQVPYYFKQGRIVVHPGETVTWRNLTVEPHSISIVDPATLPTSAAEIDTCRQCDQFLGLHAPTVGPKGPQPPFVAALDNSRSSAAQLPQLKSLGDSILVSEQGNTYPSTVGGVITDSVSAAITAARGTTLTYFCALHSWMQGTIEVR